MISLEEYVYNLLDEKLPAHLTYHDKSHTQNVVAAAMDIANKEHVSNDDIQILKAASLLHDAGYHITAYGHEEKSCELAKEILPIYNFTAIQIDAVCKIIMATKIPQSPKNKLSEILCDADVYYLGTDTYTAEAEKLYQEMQSSNPVSRDEWLMQQISFLKLHHYFTATANKELNTIKNKNLAALESQVAIKNKTKKHYKFSLFKSWQDAVLILLGVIIAGFGLKGFLVPNDFFDGGISGVSLLIHKIFRFNLAYVVALANLPFIILGKVIVDYSFAIKTAICIALLSICIYVIPYPTITSDKVLVSIFGGFFLGIGNGLIMRAGSSIDGIEILALFTRRKTDFTTSEIILAINFIIFLIAAIMFGVSTAMYSMITYFTASRTVDYVVEGIEAYTGVTIISGKSEMLKDKLVNELGRGITIYKGERGYLPGSFDVHSDTDIIFTVVTRLEIRRLKEVVYETDPVAFVFAGVIKEASGGVLKRRRIHH